jgi:hypothetical protein
VGPRAGPDAAENRKLFSILKIAMKGTTFEAVSCIQETVTREVKAIQDEAFPGHSIRFVREVSIFQKRAWTISSGGINTYFLSFLCGFSVVSVRELICHTVSNLEARFLPTV